MERLTLRALRARSWNYAQWGELSEQERVDILAYELVREKERERVRAAIDDMAKRPPPPKGSKRGIPAHLSAFYYQLLMDEQ